MTDQKEYGNYNGDIVNRHQKRLQKTKDYSDDNYNQEEYNPEMVVNVSPSGHVRGHDNTKGKERVFDWHFTGTGFEILKDGTKIHKVIGNHWSYIKGGSNVTTQGNADIKYVGHYRQNVDGGFHEEIKGNSTTYVGGSSAHHTVGNHTQTTTGALTVASEKALVLSSKGQDKDQAPVRISLGGKDGTVYITGAKHVVFKATEDYMIEAPKVAFKCNQFGIDCSGDVDIKGNGHVNLTSSGATNIKSSSDLKLDAGGTLHAKSSSDPKVTPPWQTGASSADTASPAHTDHFPEEPGDVKSQTPVDTTPTS